MSSSPLAPYVSGPDRYKRFAEDVLDLELDDEVQTAILRAIAEYQYTLIVAGNGNGKSYGVSAACDAFLKTNLPSIVLLTSGSYSMLDDTTWRPLKSLHKRARERFDVPGRIVENPPRLLLDDDWYFKAVSPRDPDDLEGRHEDNILVVVEEADKPNITADTIDSAGSSITDGNDRMVVIANPPKSEDNIVYDLMNSDRWHTLQFGSDSSRNVRVDAGLHPGPKIPGLVDLGTVVDDYEEWNSEPWPAVEDQWAAHPDTEGDYPGIAVIKKEHAGEVPDHLIGLFRPGLPIAFNRKPDGSPVRDDLDARWYRRRMGNMPPSGADVPRPVRTAYVESAKDRWPFAEHYSRDDGPLRHVIGIDVARGGGDRTVVVERQTDRVVESLAEANLNEPSENFEAIADVLASGGPVMGPVVIDAVGEGSGVADRLIDAFPRMNIVRFGAGESAIRDDRYRNARAEAFANLGQGLQNDYALDPEGDLGDEVSTLARAMEYVEKTLKAGTVFGVTSKKDLKKELDGSPDLADAASLMAWGDENLGGGAGGLTW